jgi:hypothetical protein
MKDFLFLYFLKDVELEWTGKCAEKGGKEGAGAGNGGGGPPILTTGFDNSMPQIRNPVDRINVMAGELLQYQVPLPAVRLNLNKLAQIVE